MPTDAAAPRGPAGPRWALHVSFVAALVLLCGLGTWQVLRLQWKTQLLERISQAQTAPAEPLTAVLNRLSDHVDVDYVRVQFDCPGLEQGPTLQVYAVREDGPGRRVVTACSIDGGPYRTLLVDRGFLTGKPSAPSTLSEPVVGVLRRPDKPGLFTPPHLHSGDVWYYRDTAAMAAELGAAAPAPVILMLERPAPASGNPAPAPVPVSVSNNHLGYAITWFGLAAALVGVYIAFLRRARGR